MAQKKSQDHIYDYAIIGSGLSGLSIATALSCYTDNVALLESSDVPGGMNRAIKFPSGIINNGLRYIPDSESARNAIHFLENILALKVADGSSEVSPVTYLSGSLKPFIGFGDSPPAFYEELNYFTANRTLNLKLEPYAWTQQLFEKFKGEFMPRSYVTKFHSLNDQVTQVLINGAKTLNAHNFIFCGSVKELALLLPEQALTPRTLQRLNKNLYWTSLCLDICHSHEVTETTAMHILNGTTEDEIGPCVGKFLPATQENDQVLQASQWMTFIEDEVAENSEVVGATLKKVKRQIKRAYPEALESIRLERIVVAQQVAGSGELKLNANQSFPGLENLWIGSAAVNSQKNLIGALSQAQMVVAALGFDVTAPMPSQKPDVLL